MNKYNLFAIPHECVSRDKALSVFRQISEAGELSLGIVQERVFWCYEKDNSAWFMPLFHMDSNPIDILEAQSFEPIERKQIFCNDGIIYYFCDEGDVLRVDIVFSEALACNILSLIHDINITEARLSTVIHDNEFDGATDIVWLAQDQEKMLALPVFMEQAHNFIIRSKQDRCPCFSLLNDNDFFNFQGIVWITKNCADGQKIQPFYSECKIHS